MTKLFLMIFASIASIQIFAQNTTELRHKIEQIIATKNADFAAPSAAGS